MATPKNEGRRALAALLLAGVVGGLLVAGLGSPEERAARRALVVPATRAAAPRVEKKPLAAHEAERTVSCHGELSTPLEQESARLQAAVAELDRPDASVTDLQDLGSLL